MKNIQLCFLFITFLFVFSCSKRTSVNSLYQLKMMNVSEIQKISKSDNFDKTKLDKEILSELRKSCKILGKDISPIYELSYSENGATYSELAILHQVFVYQDNYLNNKEVRKNTVAFLQQLKINLNQDLKGICK